MVKVPPILSPAQVELLCRQPQFYKYKCMIWLLYALALRNSELCLLRQSQIDIIKKIVIIDGKGDKQRRLPLTARMVAVIESVKERYEPLEYLFENCYRQPYTARGLRSIVACAASAAGLYHVWPHLLRHSRATSLVDNRVEIGQVKQLLGHSDLRTTMIYTHYSVEGLRKVL